MMTENNNLIQKEYYRCEKYFELVRSLIKKINTTPNIIVAIGKGGLIPGVILAEHYEINCLNLGLRSYNKQQQVKIHEYQSLNDHFNVLRDANILIVDDISDTGDTFLYTLKKFKSNFCEKVETASVFFKTGSKFKPDYYALECDPKTWIVQPWEFTD